MSRKYYKPTLTRVFPGQAVKIGRSKYGLFHVYYLGDNKFTLINRKSNEGYGPIAEYPSLVGLTQGVPISSLYGRDLSGKNGNFREFYNPERTVDIKIYPRREK